MTQLQAGDKAPDFKTTDQDGNRVSLKDFKGKKVLLYFYPHDDTPTCTVQACNLRDHYQELSKAGITVLGVSIDSEQKHKKFAAKHQLPFTLLVDESLEIVHKYGVYGEKQFMGRTIIGTHRTSFLIDERGLILHVIDKVKSKEHAAQVLSYFQ